MGLPTGRVNARSGRVCMFVCANVHAPFLSKAPYINRRILSYILIDQLPFIAIFREEQISDRGRSAAEFQLCLHCA